MEVVKGSGICCGKELSFFDWFLLGRFKVDEPPAKECDIFILEDMRELDNELFIVVQTVHVIMDLFVLVRCLQRVLILMCMALFNIEFLPFKRKCNYQNISDTYHYAVK